jgi:hypothetical protein
MLPVVSIRQDVGLFTPNLKVLQSQDDGFALWVSWLRSLLSKNLDNRRLACEVPSGGPAALVLSPQFPLFWVLVTDLVGKSDLTVLLISHQLACTLLLTSSND